MFHTFTPPGYSIWPSQWNHFNSYITISLFNRTLMFENMPSQLLEGYRKKIQHTYFQHFVAILYSCWPILSWGNYKFFSSYGKIHFLWLCICCIDFNCNVSSADNKCREESAKLLGCLVRNCERLILPYVAPVQKV